MTCPICGSSLYEKDRNERTAGTFISIRCSNKSCNYYNYITVPADFNTTITGRTCNFNITTIGGTNNV